ncbi:hypothetical protein SGFS_014930 [Streptomyces graminofaciens]|uniref:CHAT domain-containing protein n=1 Tax=Streptomyces graminofaciens TaxID=68212 RepID=A0ABM7F322_9ACTN|nr:tetratricopeptide repeat protein [Streptomyces graminofaciens]BBC30199.1 hypothetical protein SGFS_014930 [Streptomyces graminofaciens]
MEQNATGFRRGMRVIGDEAEQARVEGDAQRTLDALVRGVDRARNELAAGDGEAFVLYAYFAFRACEVYESLGRSEPVADVAGELWRRSRAHESPLVQLGAAQILARVHALHGRLDAAVQHAVSVPALLEAVEEAVARPEHGLFEGFVERGRIAKLLLLLVHHIYYIEKNHPACVDVCRALLRIAPDDAEAAAILAFSTTFTGDSTAAVGAYRRALELDPLRGGLTTGLATALAEVGRLDEALDVQSLAIEQKPDELIYRVNRAQLHRMLGNEAAAIVDYDHVLEALNGAAVVAGPDPTDGAAPEPYVWRMSPQEVAVHAAVSRLGCLAEISPPELVAEEALSLLEGADESTRRDVNRILGDALRRAGRTKEACDAYAQVLAAGDESSETRITLCEWLAECGQIDDAVRELAVLADAAEPFPEPEAARKILADLVGRFPSHMGALRARGQAEYATTRPAQAVATLSQVLERCPDDGWALLWRGLAWVSHSNEPEPAEQGWNDGFSLTRVRHALMDLARAAQVDGDHRQRARHACGWLLERAMWSPRLRDMLMIDLSVTEHLTAALPGLDIPFEALHKAHTEDNPERRWYEASSELDVARAGMEALGLPLLAALADTMRADSLIQLHRMQEAIDALERAEKAVPLMALDPDHLVGDELGLLTRSAHSEGSEYFVFPYETLELATHLIAEMVDYLNQLRVEATVRLGNAEEALGTADKFILERGRPQRARLVFQKAVVLRDSGRYDEALSLLDSLTDDSLTLDEELWRENLRVTILMNCERLDDAHTLARQVLDRIPADLAYERTVLQANLSGALVMLNRPEEALRVLDGMEFVPEITRQQQKMWHYMRASALAQLGEYARALVDFRAALSIAEELRQTLKGVDARISWQAEHVSLHQEAMNCALRAGDVNTLFELLERSKAQAFLDQLDADGTVLDDRTEELRTHLMGARVRRAVLRELASAPDPAAELELLHAYARHGGRWSVNRGGTETADVPVTPVLVEVRLEEEQLTVRRLESLYDSALVVGHMATADRVMGAEEIGDQLRLMGEGSALLVEYLIMDECVLVFFLRAGDSVPRMERIDLPESELVSLVTELLPPRTGGTSRPISATVLERFAPLVEPLLRHSRPGDVLWVVPHRVLHQVPLHAVPVDGVPLLRTRAVCYTPSAAVLSRCQKARAARLVDRKAAGLGDRWTSASVFGDSRSDLPHSRFEAREVAALFGTRALLGSEAKASTLLERVARPDCPDVLHLACHGRFSAARSLESGVLLAPETGAVQGGAALTAEDIMRLSLSTDLVVLSACDSGRSEARAGDELIGLARALLQAKAPSVLVSLWPVSDLSTCLLMESFYRRAKGTRSTTLADALRWAQLTVADLTAEKVIEYCDRRIGEAEGVERTLLQLDRADIQILAGDFSSVVALYRELAENSATPASDAVRRIKAGALRKLPLLELRAMTDEEVDYSVKPFSDPYYWASFVLVGDWR